MPTCLLLSSYNTPFPYHSCYQRPSLASHLLALSKIQASSQDDLQLTFQLCLPPLPHFIFQPNSIPHWSPNILSKVFLHIGAILPMFKSQSLMFHFHLTFPYSSSLSPFVSHNISFVSFPALLTLNFVAVYILIFLLSMHFSLGQ